MIKRYQLEVEGINYPVVISDESEALLAAAAAGSAVVGLWHPGAGQDLSMADYLVERLEDADEPFLEKVIRRAHGFPLRIAETKRLRIREFLVSDWEQVPAEPEDRDGDRVFYDRELLGAYICSQYRFFDYGLWALEETGSGRLIGKAGITGTVQPAGQRQSGLELGYHIFRPYRQQGYAHEACRAIVQYAVEELAPPYLYIKTDASNEASVHLAEKLGFKVSGHNEGMLSLFRFAENW